jgi:hypothetical protein
VRHEIEGSLRSSWAGYGTGMGKFIAEVSFRFESGSLESAGAALRRLGDAASDAGFELVRGKVTPAPPKDEDDSGWTSYAPLETDDR